MKKTKANVPKQRVKPVAQSGWRRKLASGERGAALIEFALIVPLLILFIGAIIDFGDAWFRVAAGSAAVRTAAVTGFDAGDERMHDLRVLQTVLSESDNRDIDNVTKVIIFEPEGDGSVPASCLTDAAAINEGQNDTCVVYGPAFLEEVRDGTAAASFVGTCGASRDHRWCVPDRRVEGGWWIGVYLEAEEESLLGLMPGFSEFKIRETAVIMEWPRAESAP